MLNRALLTSAIAALAATALSVPASAADGMKPNKVTISVGNPGTPWNVIGTCITQIMSEHGVRSNTELGAGLSNVATVSSNKTNYGFTMAANMPLATRGEKPYPKPITNARGVAAMSINVTHVAVLADSGVKTFADLKGKPFATQPIGNTTTYAFELLIKTAGLSGEDDLQITRGGQNFGANQMKDRKVVGYTATSEYPAASFSEASQSIDVRFLDVTDEHLAKVRAMNDGFVRQEVPPNTYKGQTDPIHTIGTTGLLITNAEQSEEEVYWFTKQLAMNIDRLQMCHSSAEYMNKNTIAKTPGIDLHPGAARYYKETGAIN